MQQIIQQAGYLLAGGAGYLQAPFCFVEQGFNMNVFRQLQKLAAPEIFTKMSYPYIGCYGGVWFKINVVKPPVMWQVGSHQHYIACFKLFDTVANKLCAFTFFKMDKFYFGVIMPAIINIRHQILPYTKGMLGLLGYFQK